MIRDECLYCKTQTIVWKIINFDLITNENNKIHTPNWSNVLDYPYRILIIGRSGSVNALLNLINHEPDTE